MAGGRLDISPKTPYKIALYQEAAMHAVVQIGSHQYNVEPGKTITVEKLDGQVGSEVHFKHVLLIANGKEVSVGKEVSGDVIGKITEQFRGDKILVFKKKRRKGYNRKQGHRQPYTRVEITSIAGA